MTQTLRLASSLPTEVLAVAKVLGRENVRVAGGAVRDLLAGVTPKDFDLATPLRPELVKDTMEAHGFTVLPTGLQHGTVTVMVDGMPIEVTTLRVDVETDGRHAEVEFTENWREDAERRDLTINAMFMDMDGHVYDYFGGEEDLKAGTIHFVGDPELRIQEDYLRILRFFRFHGRMGSLRFDLRSLGAIQQHAGGLKQISGERIWAEMKQIMSGPRAYTMLEVMSDCDVFAPMGLHQLVVDEWTDVAISMGGQPVTVLAAMAHGSDQVVDAVIERWKLSREEQARLRFLTRKLQESHQSKMATWKAREWKRTIVTEGRERTMEMLALTGMVGSRDMLKDWEVPKFPVTGKDLIAAGMKPGPAMGRALARLREDWLDSDYTMSKDNLILADLARMRKGA